MRAHLKRCLSIDKGADVDKADDEGCTPLYMACQEGHDDAVQLLLRHNAGVNRVYEEKNETPLFVAAEFDHPSIVQVLIDAGAELDIESTEGGAALKVALDKGHGGVAEILRKAGAGEIA